MNKPIHSRFNDLEGKTFGALTVVGYSGRQGSNNMWNCACDCGTERPVRDTLLTSGKIKRCKVCAGKEHSVRQTKHGFYGTKVYRTFMAIHQRCENPKASNYDKYGGRGKGGAISTISYLIWGNLKTISYR